ncbi:hypothetical protein HGB07_07345 [Candidatus Roizmanbacteria bacterium]|nr:hypothetical protein [Candidatus Roizmanbacteria bacterium]
MNDVLFLLAIAAGIFFYFRWKDVVKKTTASISSRSVAQERAEYDSSNFLYEVDWDEAVPVRVALRLDYRDRNGSVTERIVDVQRFFLGMGMG